MKRQLKRLVSTVLMKFTSSKWVWSFYKPLAEVNADIYISKKNEENAQAQRLFFEKYKHLISDEVKNGPFQGLKYPFFSSLHSTLLPKLLGCYEFELNESLKKVFQKTYSSILDIGCAEGYYAVGLARKFPDSIIYAADINPEAREKTKVMANANGIADTDKFRVIAEVTPDFLLGLDPSQRHLIFSDCEGYESVLFSDAVINHLSKSDFIVELHDFTSPGVSDLLRSRFQNTHSIDLIKSIDDIFRYRKINIPEIQKIPLSDQISILAEKRPTQMEWIFCEPKKN
ncbi:class I SAM-dependent methyltransferase [Algoriphagus yeomjeoni]|nr:class I SAM-dependent methyltransferase [Algoriphagus yeomjeoni]